MKKVLAVLCVISLLLPLLAWGSEEVPVPSISLSEWADYYRRNGVSFFTLPAQVVKDQYDDLYEHVVCTVVKVKSVKSKSITAEIPEVKPGLFSGFKLKFNDHKDMAPFKKGELIAVVGVMGKESFITDTLTLSECRIVASGDKVQEIEDIIAQLEVNGNYEKFIQDELERMAQEDTAAFIKSCVEVDYTEVSRWPDKYKDLPIKVTGKVVALSDVLPGLSFVIIEQLGEQWFFMYKRADGQRRVLKNDLLEIYGTFNGVTDNFLLNWFTKESIPSIVARYYDTI